MVSLGNSQGRAPLPPVLGCGVSQGSVPREPYPGLWFEAGLSLLDVLNKSLTEGFGSAWTPSEASEGDPGKMRACEGIRLAKGRRGAGMGVRPEGKPRAVQECCRGRVVELWTHLPGPLVSGGVTLTDQFSRVSLFPTERRSPCLPWPSDLCGCLLLTLLLSSGSKASSGL